MVLSLLTYDTLSIAVLPLNYRAGVWFQVVAGGGGLNFIPEPLFWPFRGCSLRSP